MTKNLTCVGKITSPHGVKGAVKVKSYTEIPESLIDYAPLYSKNGEERFNIDLLSVKGEMLIIKIDGIDDRNAAIALRNKELHANKELFPDLKEDEFFYDDLIGTKARLENGEEFGVIIAVQNYGGGDILEIQCNKNNKAEFFPFTKEIFPEINQKECYITICPPEIEVADNNENG